MAEGEFSEIDLTDQKMDNLLWSANETALVGTFLKNTPTISLKESLEHFWSKISLSTDFSEEETSLLAGRAKKLVESVKFNSPEQDNTLVGEKPSKDEYYYQVQKSFKVLLQIAADSLRNSGIWDSEEYRRVAQDAGFRKEEGKTGFSQDELYWQEKNIIEYLEKRFVLPSEGGPDIVAKIYAPTHESIKDSSSTRIRGSLGHEIMHNIRAFSNKNFWKGFEETAERHNLEKFATKEKNIAIGGYRVASNMQGSEGIGELFNVIIKFQTNNERSPNIKEVIPEIAESTQKSIRKFEDGSMKKNRYLASKYALLHHLVELDKAGCGEVPAINLLALSSFGYVSLEKVPSLIALGIITPEKYQKMRSVLTIITNWLTAT